MSSSFKVQWNAFQVGIGEQTETQLKPDTKVYDPDNAFNLSMGCWEPPVPAGKTCTVILDGQVVWLKDANDATVPGSYAKVYWKKNDVLIASEHRVEGSASQAALGCDASVQDIASPGDEYEAFIWGTNGGGTTQILGNTDGRSFLCGTMLD